MNRNSRRLSVYILLMLLTSGAATALRTAAMFNDLDYRWGYYGSKSLILAAGIVATASAVLMLTYGFVARRVALSPSFSSPDTYVPTGIAGIALIFLLVRIVGECAERFTQGGSILQLLAEPMTLTLLLLIPLGLLSLLHFFLNAYLTEGHHSLRAGASLGTILFLAAYAALLYFSTDLPINSPNKLVDELAYLAATTFFLYEARISLGREKWRAYGAIGLVAASLCAFSSVPSLILYAVRGEVASRCIEESVLTFTLFIFILSRLILTVKLSECGENESIVAMRRYAEERAEATAAATDRHAHAFAIQMTIDDLIAAEDGAAPILVAEEIEEHRDEPKEDPPEAHENEGLDAISIFDTDEVRSVAERMADPEPHTTEEPLLIISSTDTGDADREVDEADSDTGDADREVEEADTARDASTPDDETTHERTGTGGSPTADTAEGTTEGTDEDTAEGTTADTAESITEGTAEDTAEDTTEDRTNGSTFEDEEE